jgi:hypothetical protein
MPAPKSYLCPVDIRHKDFTLPVGQGGRQNKLSSYLMNGAVCGYEVAGNSRAQIYKSCKTTQVWNPLCYLMWEPDEDSIYQRTGQPLGAQCFNDGSNEPSVSTGEGIGLLHDNRGGSALNISGSVSFLTVKQFNYESAPPFQGYHVVGGKVKTLLWWSPWTSDGANQEAGIE